MHGDWLLLVLRGLHVLGGVMWVGGVVFLARYLLPAVRAAGPGAGPVMQQLSARGLPNYLPILAVVTVFSGIGLYWRDSDGFRAHEWLRSGSAMAFGTGGLIALGVFILGMTVISPAGRRMAQLGSLMQQAGGPPAAEQVAEMQRVQARLGSTSSIAAVLLVIATLFMAIARYV